MEAVTVASGVLIKTATRRKKKRSYPRGNIKKRKSGRRVGERKKNWRRVAVRERGRGVKNSGSGGFCCKPAGAPARQTPAFDRFCSRAEICLFNLTR